MSRLDLDRDQILAFRRRCGHLGERLPEGRPSLRRAAWAGLQDSMPRAALLSVHARVAGTTPGTLNDASLLQVWGPRFSVYVVAERDLAVFTVGRMAEKREARELSFDLADRLHALLEGREMPFGEAGRALGEPPNRLRYAAPTGRVLLRWDGARQPLIRTVSPPAVEPDEARLELARRYIHIYGPTTAESFAKWAGVAEKQGADTFAALRGELIPVSTPIGDAWILAEDEDDYPNDSAADRGVRLLPSGDTYYLLHGDDRRLLVPAPERRNDLWTSRVWPGALLVGGEVVGTWRRSQHRVDISPWRRLSQTERDAIAVEAISLPIPGLDRDILVTWGG